MNSFFIESIGIVGFLFIIFGYYLNANKKQYCFYVWGVGNMIFIVYAILINAFSILLMSIFTLSMNIYGLYSWSTEEE